jgi:hypothetical protein
MDRKNYLHFQSPFLSGLKKILQPPPPPTPLAAKLYCISYNILFDRTNYSVNQRFKDDVNGFFLHLGFASWVLILNAKSTGTNLIVFESDGLARLGSLEGTVGAVVHLVEPVVRRCKPAL